MISIRGVKDKTEQALVARWAAGAFSPDLEGGLHFWVEELPRSPNYEIERQRVAEVEGQLVSHLIITDREMQFGLATLRMGGDRRRRHPRGTPRAGICRRLDARHGRVSNHSGL